MGSSNRSVFVGAGGINCILTFTLDSAINYENNERINELRVRFEEGIVNKGELEKMGRVLLGKEILVGDLEIIKNCSSSTIFTAEGMKLKSAEDYRKLIREFIGENVKTNFETIQNLAEV
ncbi:2374_t:CDS:2 [Funneliformis geosporum]|nr:2374_t:CDS:2 [Funneliformis geosporum]